MSKFTPEDKLQPKIGSLFARASNTFTVADPAKQGETKRIIVTQTGGATHTFSNNDREFQKQCDIILGLSRENTVGE